MVLVLGKMKGWKTHLSLLHLQDSGKVNGRKQIEMTKSQTLPTHQIITVFLLLFTPGVDLSLERGHLGRQSSISNSVHSRSKKRIFWQHGC